MNILSFKTSFGWDYNLLKRITKFRQLNLVRKKTKEKVIFLTNLKTQILEFTKGKRKKISTKLKITGTPLQKKIWHQLSLIRYGSTKTYGDIAKILKTSPRYVGNVCGQNNHLLIIPCHRVVRSDSTKGEFRWFLRLGRHKTKNEIIKFREKMSKNILILQHINIETPGYILDLMKKDQFNLTTIELDEGEIYSKRFKPI